MCTRRQFKFAFSSHGANKKKPQGGFAAKKKPGFLAARCVPGRNSNLHFCQGALTNQPAAVPPNKYARLSGFLAAKFAPGRNSNSIFCQMALRKDPDTVSPPKKRNSGPRRFFRGEMRPGSKCKFALAPEGSKKKKGRFRGENAMVIGFFGGGLRTRSQLKFALPSGGAKKKKQGRFCRKNRLHFRGGFSGQMCSRLQFKCAFSPQGA